MAENENVIQEAPWIFKAFGLILASIIKQVEHAMRRAMLCVNSVNPEVNTVGTQQTFMLTCQAS